MAKSDATPAAHSAGVSSDACHGASQTMKVPPGTVVIDAAEGYTIKDLARAGDSVVAAQGGEPLKLGDLPSRVGWSPDGGYLLQLRRNHDALELWQCRAGEWRWRRRSTLDLGAAPGSHAEFLPFTIHPDTGELLLNRRASESALILFDNVDPKRW